VFRPRSELLASYRRGPAIRSTSRRGRQHRPGCRRASPARRIQRGRRHLVVAVALERDTDARSRRPTEARDGRSGSRSCSILHSGRRISRGMSWRPPASWCWAGLTHAGVAWLRLVERANFSSRALPTARAAPARDLSAHRKAGGRIRSPTARRCCARRGFVLPDEVLVTARRRARCRDRASGLSAGGMKPSPEHFPTRARFGGVPRQSHDQGEALRPYLDVL